MNSGKVNTAAITGIGILSPIGNSKEEVLNSLRTFKDGIGEASKIDVSSFLSHKNAEVKNVNFSEKLTQKELEDFTDPYLRMALVAAKDALHSAKVDVESDSENIAMVLATCNAGMNSQEAEYTSELGISGKEFTRKESMQGEFFAIARVFASALKITGATFVINTACSGSTAAVAIAKMLVNQGYYKKVLAGGADAMSLANFAGFSALKVVSTEKTAPFSEPVGMNIGEGAAFWVVENIDDARSRKVEIFGKVIGHSTTADAHHPTQPDPRGDGAYRTMRNAVLNAGVAIDNIACINAHGSGTSANDKAEVKAIAKFCGENNIPFTSTKSYTGHCMGATGIIEATCQLLAMNDNFIPPTLHFTTSRAGVEIAPVSGGGIETEYDCFLSANYAFAGNNAGIVVAKERFENYNPATLKTVRPVISGHSCVSSLGVGVRENLEALSKGVVGIKDIVRFESPCKAGMVELPPLRTINRRLDFSGMNLISTFATIASAQALENASLRVQRSNTEDIGLVGTVSRGSSEEAHMLGVFADSQRRGDIACFSNVTANSTAGWVSKALEIKGANITFTSGHNSSLQALEYASMLLQSGDAKHIVAFASDELYQRQLRTYARFGYLRDYKKLGFALNYSSAYHTMFGEGASAVVVEDLSSAQERNANVLGEILSTASTIDGGDFYDSNLRGIGLRKVVELALKRANVSAKDIDIIAWSPRGTAQDALVVNLRDELFGKIPLATTVFNTGYMETSSALHSVGCLLECLCSGENIWRQGVGIDLFDNTPFPSSAKLILAMSSSITGNCHASVIAR